MPLCSLEDFLALGQLVAKARWIEDESGTDKLFDKSYRCEISNLLIPSEGHQNPIWLSYPIDGKFFGPKEHSRHAIYRKYSGSKPREIVSYFIIRNGSDDLSIFMTIPESRQQI